MQLSIILPVYNVEKYLPDCFDSLFAQDIPESEYEIICVDDGSPDGSGKVVQTYQRLHNNIVYIQQQNSGVSKARNAGFNAAKGKYVWFIDPDDMICANCFGTILRQLEEHQADLLELDYRTCEEEEHFSEESVDISIDGQNKEGSSGSGCLSVCLASYLRTHSIHFNEELSYGEDYLWAFQTKYREHKSIYTNAKIYIYRQRRASAMHAAHNSKRARKHVADLLLLSQIYLEEYRRCACEGMEPAILDNINRRRQLSIEGALTCLMKMGLSILRSVNMIFSYCLKSITLARDRYAALTISASISPLCHAVEATLCLITKCRLQKCADGLTAIGTSIAIDENKNGGYENEQVETDDRYGYPSGNYQTV